MTHPALADGPIYLDYNATTPIDPRVIDTALPYLTTHFGNPSSSHQYADVPREAVRQARSQLADLLGASPDEIVFTGGGSEADTFAIRGAALAGRALGRGDHIITQPTEHPAVLEACRSLTCDGFSVTHLPVGTTGLVDPSDLHAALTSRSGHARDQLGTVLVSIAHANSETGTLQPVTELAAIAHRHGALFHTDAAQTVGKVPIDVTRLGVDLLTVVGHKMYAPKGIGALYVRPGVELQPLISGGGQERGMRAGTENVASIVALGAAAQIAATELPEAATRLVALRDLLHHQLRQLLPDRVHLNGHPSQRLPGTLNVSIDGTASRIVLAAAVGIAASTGSACHEDSDVPSPVLTAMGISAEQARSAIRLSIGRWTTDDQIHAAARLLASHATTLPAESSADDPVPGVADSSAEPT